MLHPGYFDQTPRRNEVIEALIPPIPLQHMSKPWHPAMIKWHFTACARVVRAVGGSPWRPRVLLAMIRALVST